MSSPPNLLAYMGRGKCGRVAPSGGSQGRLRIADVANIEIFTLAKIGVFLWFLARQKHVEGHIKSGYSHGTV